MAVSETARVRTSLSKRERTYLAMGLNAPGGKLPIFDQDGQEINAQMIRRCLDLGLCERWFANPIKPDWLVCRLTPMGRAALK